VLFFVVFLLAPAPENFSADALGPLNNKFSYFYGKVFIHCCKFVTFTHLKHGEQILSVNLFNDRLMEAYFIYSNSNEQHSSPVLNQ